MREKKAKEKNVRYDVFFVTRGNGHSGQMVLQANRISDKWEFGQVRIGKMGSDKWESSK